MAVDLWKAYKEGVTNGGGNFYFLKGKTNKILPFLLAVVISLALMDR